MLVVDKILAKSSQALNLERVRLRVGYVMVFFMFTFLSIGFNLVFLSIPTLKNSLLNINIELRHPLLVVFFIFIGYLLFLLRKNNLLLYAITEISFAISMIWHVTSQANQLLPILAAVYILVRGLTNMDEAKKTQIISSEMFSKQKEQKI